MTAKIKRKSVRTSRKASVSPFSIYWTKENYLFLFGGVFLLILGYILLSVGNWYSTTSLYFAPIVLFAVYVIIFPLAIMFAKRNKPKVEEEKVD